MGRCAHRPHVGEGMTMSRWLSYRRILPSALAAVLAMMGPTNAWASTYSAGAQITVSGPSPFASCPFGPPGTVNVNAEVEPRVAGAPGPPQPPGGGWQQDRWDKRGPPRLVGADSPPGGGPRTQFLPPEAKSHAFRGVPMFSRSTDGGQTWEPARSMLQGNPNDFTIGNQIVVLPDGTLVDVTFLGTGSGVQPSNHNFIAVLRSTDRGVSWSRPIVVATFEGAGVSDPDTGFPVRAGDNLPEAAVDATSGSVYITWGDGRFSNFSHDDIALSRSNDGGFSWSDPIRVNQTPVPVSAFLATPAVASDGTVGVSYYDFRNNTPDRSRLPTDVWLVHCHARTSNCTSPGSWSSETHLIGSFDLDTAPVARSRVVCDYESLVGN